MKTHNLTFKEPKDNIGNLNISTVKAITDGCYVVEIWDVTKPYDSRKMLDRDIKELEELLKTVTDSDRKDEIKKIISSQRKSNNKRILVPIEEFDDMFNVTEYVVQKPMTYIKEENKEKVEEAVETISNYVNPYEDNLKIVLWYSHDLKMGNGYCWYDSTESFTYESGYVSRGALYVTKELPKVYKLADTYFDHSK